MQSLWGLLNQPFVVTGLGALFLAFQAHRWQSNQQRNALQLELLRTFPSIFDKRGSLFNSWFLNLVWLIRAKQVEQGKQMEQTQKDRIDRFDTAVHKYQDLFFDSESFDGMLTAIEAAFHMQNVKEAAGKLQGEWDKFEDEFARLNDEYNRMKGSIPSDVLERAEQAQKTIRKKLTKLEAELLRAMAKEISS